MKTRAAVEIAIVRRLSTTPVPPSWVPAAQIVIAFCITGYALVFALIARRFFRWE